MYQGRQNRSICRSIFKKLKNTLGYFGDNSTLHGVSHVFSLSYIPFYKRQFWLAILTTSIACAVFITRQVLSLYSGGFVSYVIETNYLEFDTPFPAVTICEPQNNDKISAYIKKNKLPSAQSLFLKDVVYFSEKACNICASCKPNQTCFENFYDIVMTIRASCKELLTDCWWADQPFQCCDRFLPIETEYGVCFVFNSRLVGNATLLTLNRTIGLPSLVISAVQAVGIRVHSPDDMVSVGLENPLGRPVVVPLITDYEIILRVEQTISSTAVTHMPTSARDCLLKDERPAFARDWPSTRYTYGTCMLYCRALAQADLCNCTHHLMPKISDVPPCNLQGLVCLGHNKELLGAKSCNCPLGCEEVTYKLVHIFNDRFKGKDVTPELVARGTRITVRLGQLPSWRVKRAAMRHTLGLVVDIGGVAGVFFGASLLSAIEIFYLLCFRKK